MNKKIISAILAAMMVIPALAACGGKDGGAIGGADGTTGIEISDSVEVKDTSKPESAEVPTEVTPTFMYFVSAQDKDYDAAMQTVSELQEQYGEQIDFQITNIDENPEAAENFPVAGQTPALIMLNTSNDISAIEFQTSDKAALEADIKAALSK